MFRVQARKLYANEKKHCDNSHWLIGFSIELWLFVPICRTRNSTQFPFDSFSWLPTASFEILSANFLSLRRKFVYWEHYSLDCISEIQYNARHIYRESRIWNWKIKLQNDIIHLMSSLANSAWNFSYENFINKSFYWIFWEGLV